MASEQKGFIVYGDNEVVFDRLTDEEAGQLLKAMTKYFNSGTEPSFDSPLTEIVWLQVKLQMDRNADKYQKRCEKNRENVKKRYERIQTNTNVYDGIRTNTNATNRDRDKDREKDRDSDRESVPDVFSLSSFLIGYLNEKTGSGYVVDGSVTDRVKALTESGYSQDQIRTVIDKQCVLWLNDPVMRQYLRPSTLFGDKFSEYLNAPLPLAAEKEQKQAESRASLERSLSEKREALDSLRDSLNGASKEERRHLRENIAILEDSIGLIEKRLGRGVS